jgi:hypothetical protein
LLFVGALLIAFKPSAVKAQQPPLREGCRAVSKLEYDIAKMEYVLISRGGRYVQTGHIWRPYFGGATSKVKGSANEGLADRRRFIVGCLLPGLDAVGASIPLCWFIAV